MNTSYVMLMLSSGAILVAEQVETDDATITLEDAMMLVNVRNGNQVGIALDWFFPKGIGKVKINRLHILAMPEKIEPDLLRLYRKQRSNIIIPKGAVS